MTEAWPSPVVDLVASRFALLSDPTRVHLLTQLEQHQEATVQQLAEELPSTPQNISRHLCILHRSGLVTRRREGTSTYYSLADFSACRLLDQVLASVRGQIDELSDVVNLAA